MYASSSVKDGYTAQPRCYIWTLIELLIACKLESVTEGPFDNSSAVSETTACKRREVLDEILSHAYVELVFEYQRRQFVFAALFLGKYARVVRFGMQPDVGPAFSTTRSYPSNSSMARPKAAGDNSVERYALPQPLPVSSMF